MSWYQLKRLKDISNHQERYLIESSKKNCISAIFDIYTRLFTFFCLWAITHTLYQNGYFYTIYMKKEQKEQI